MIDNYPDLIVQRGVDSQKSPLPKLSSSESVVEAHDSHLDVVDSPYSMVIVVPQIDSAVVVVAHYEARLVREIVTVVEGVDSGVDFDLEIVDFAIETDHQVDSGHAWAASPCPGGEFGARLI